MTALVLGATGATGRALTQQLLDDIRFSEIRIFTRRHSGFAHPKLKEFVVNFDSEEGFAEVINADVAFSAMGTTLKEAGSQEAQRKVDYTYQLRFAEACQKQSVSTFVLVSSAGADSQSRFFYMKLKGELEEAIHKLEFTTTLIFRPPSLIRPDTNRFGEKVSIGIFKAFNALGILTKMKPLRVEDLAKMMITKATSDLEGWHIITPS